MVCHDANRASSTVMTNGLALNESYQFKRMIHGIHGNSKRLYPFTHGNTVVGAFCNPANPLSKSPLCDPALVVRDHRLSRTMLPRWPIRRWVSTAMPATSTDPGSRIWAPWVR